MKYAVLKARSTREALVDTQKKLEELQELYKKEKSEADENSVLLKQAEMSIQHLKVIVHFLSGSTVTLSGLPWSETYQLLIKTT